MHIICLGVLAWSQFRSEYELVLLANDDIRILRYLSFCNQEQSNLQLFSKTWRNDYVRMGYNTVLTNVTFYLENYKIVLRKGSYRPLQWNQYHQRIPGLKYFCCVDYSWRLDLWVKDVLKKSHGNASEALHGCKNFKFTLFVGGRDEHLEDLVNNFLFITVINLHSFFQALDLKSGYLIHIEPFRTFNCPCEFWDWVHSLY